MKVAHLGLFSSRRFVKPKLHSCTILETKFQV